jgi:VanZ like family/Concanavalin A-like lectin/glucanases superfamily
VLSETEMLPAKNEQNSMNKQGCRRDVTNRKDRLLQLACLTMWCGLLVAGLWPFNFFPENRVQWLKSRNGIHFDEPGQIYSAVPGTKKEGSADTFGNGSFSIEIWLQPENVSNTLRTIFFAYDPQRRKDFRIDQSITDLVVRGRFLDSNEKVSSTALYVDDCFQKSVERFITITSGAQGTVIYVEGVRGKSVPYRLDPSGLSGRLVLAHSASSKESWAGNVFGLAIYDRALTDDEARKDYQTWTAASLGDLRALGGITALYPLDEKRGELVHNRAGSMPDLVIPKTFQPLRRAFLETSFRLAKSDLLDAATNIAGFIPFGLLVSAYLHRGMPFPKYGAILLTVVVGGLSSLLIECLQAYLPTRTSSLDDLINNCLGTAMGAMLLGRVRRWLSSFCAAPRSSP